jgi:hypothetical protein
MKVEEVEQVEQVEEAEASAEVLKSTSTSR